MLIESYHIQKGDDTRYFHVRELNVLSVEGPLRVWHTDVETTITKLLDREWLGKGRRKWYKAIGDGNTVKHAFIDLEISTMWKYTKALAGATVDAKMALYRQVMTAFCEQTRPSP